MSWLEILPAAGLLMFILGWLKYDTGAILKEQRRTNGRILTLECWKEAHEREHQRETEETK